MAAEASRSAGASADSYIGSLISLTSKFEIRYEGVLYNINTEESSIGLRNVRSFGTEGRKKDGPQIPASDKIYEYILFRGSDIKDLQVKSSPPIPPAPVHNDPAIIQSHYSHPTPAPTSLPSVGSGTVADPSTHTAQLGLPRSTIQGGLPLHQAGGSIGSWGSSPTPPTQNGSGLAMPFYWQGPQGYYTPSGGLPHMQQPSAGGLPHLQQAPSGGLPHLQQAPSGGLPHMQQQPPSGGLSHSQQPPSVGLPHSQQQTSGSFQQLQQPPSGGLPHLQQTPPGGFPHLQQPPSSGLPHLQQPPLFHPPPGVPLPHSMHHLQYPGINAPVPSGSQNLPEFPPPLLQPASRNPALTSSAPASTLTPGQVISPALGVTPSLSYKPLVTTSPAEALSANLSTMHRLTSSFESNATLPQNKLSVTSKPTTDPGSTAVSQTTRSMPSIVGSSGPSKVETSVPLVTPGQLMQPSLSTLPSSQPSQTDLKVVDAKPSEAKTKSSLPESYVPAPSDIKEPILPLPTPADQKSFFQPNGAAIQNYHGNRGHGRGRGNGYRRPVANYNEEFDFTAMNEKFNKDEVWGHLGKSKAQLRDGEEDYEDDEALEDDDGAESSKLEVKKSVYVKEDFFDSLSSNALDRGTRYGRTRFSEQLKLDTETFGEFQRHRGRGGGRGFRGGRTRGSYSGRGYGYFGRGRGNTYANHNP